MNTPCSLLLDIGGTYLKFGLVDSHCHVTSEENFKIPDFLENSNPSIKEWSPTSFLKVCHQLIFEMLQKYPVVDKIYITGQMGGWIVTDLENKPCSNLVSWQDTRFDNPSPLSENWLRLTGNELRRGLPLFGAKYFLASEGTRPVRLHTLLTFVAYSLVQQRDFISHKTDFSSTGLVDIENNSYVDEAIAYVGENLDLPRIVSDILSIGNLSGSNIQVFTPLGDQQCSVFGVGLDVFSIVINIGTGGQVVKLNNPGEPFNYQLRPYFFGKYLDTKTHLPAGRIITKFLETLVGNASNESFEWLDNQLLRGPKTPKQISFNLDVAFISNQVKQYALSYDKEELAYIFLNQVADVYANTIKGYSNSESITTLKLAGGIPNSLRSFSKLVAAKSNIPLLEFVNEETTLLGLAKLISDHRISS